MAKEAMNRGMEVRPILYSLICTFFLTICEGHALRLSLPGRHRFCDGHREDVLRSGESSSVNIILDEELSLRNRPPLFRSSPRGTDRRAWQPSSRRGPRGTRGNESVRVLSPQTTGWRSALNAQWWLCCFCDDQNKPELSFFYFFIYAR